MEDGMEIFSLNIYSISDYHYPAWRPSKGKGISLWYLLPLHQRKSCPKSRAPGALRCSPPTVLCSSAMHLCTTSFPLHAHGQVAVREEAACGVRGSKCSHPSWYQVRQGQRKRQLQLTPPRFSSRWHSFLYCSFHSLMTFSDMQEPVVFGTFI